ncbi:hypothetical protein HGA34_00625 [Candidatus Falkowbacteria bacterium]|nr:hypothetical protein [Candidatus Falkowbacteria bacterium]
MINILLWYNRKKEKRLAMRFASDLAFHMHSVYIYLAEQNRTLQPGSCVKEAVGLLDNWKKISENLYEHKPTGFALEVKPDSKLLPLTKDILDIELEEILTSYKDHEKFVVMNEARALVDDYFDKNSFVDKVGA